MASIVGVDHDTSAFAVASIRGWWQARGHDDYPHATRLLITADAGGSNSYRTRAWKSELAALATETGLDHGVSLPAGDLEVEQSRAPAVFPYHPQLARPPADQPRSRRRDHRGHSHPHRAAGTGQLDTGSYPLGVSVSTARMRALPVTPHDWCGSWNYTINPATQNTDQQASAVAQNTTLARSQTLKLLSNRS
jgi:hypothetical protein